MLRWEYAGLPNRVRPTSFDPYGTRLARPLDGAGMADVSGATNQGLGTRTALLVNDGMHRLESEDADTAHNSTVGSSMPRRRLPTASPPQPSQLIAPARLAAFTT